MNEDKVKALKIDVKLPKDYRLHLRFNKDLLDKFTTACKAKGKTRTEVIEDLIKLFLEDRDLK